MEETAILSDKRKIYFARKAVHLYKHFKANHARATNLLNNNMEVDDTFPPMVRVSSVEMWRNWKKLVVLLERWIKKDGIHRFESKILLNTCIVVLKMMLGHQELLKKVEMLRLDSVKIKVNRKFTGVQRAESSDLIICFQPHPPGVDGAADRTRSIFTKLQRNGQGFEEGHSRRDQGSGETH